VDGVNGVAYVPTRLPWRCTRSGQGWERGRPACWI